MKKKILLLAIALLGVIYTSTAQNNTIVNDNSAWATLYSWWSPGDFNSKSTSYYFFDGDSVFHAKTYKKVFSYKDEQHMERFFEGLIREENLKTYYKASLETFLEETILYDFSLETGNTFIHPMFDDQTLYVLQSDSVLINNVKKKRMIITLLPITPWNTDTVIETIGSLSGLLSPLCYGCTGFRELLCYTQNGELLYKNPKYSECYYNNLSTLPTIEQSIFSIFPNPATHTLFITSENEKISKIDIFDITGRNVYNKRFENYSSKYEIAVNNLLTGLYFIQIKTEKGQTLSYKFLKN